MNFKEIIDTFKNQNISVSEFAYDDFDNNPMLEFVGECKEVNHHGGEGQGEDWYSVKYFPKHDIYIKVSGFYSSYDGVEFYDGWGSCKEVKPIDRTVTFYE